MKKLILAAMVAIAGWFTCQAQSMPAPEKYNKLLEETAQLEQNKAEFLMYATMETLSKDPKGYRQMMELAERRFSDAADPIHNEGLYMVVLKHVVEKYVLSGAEIERQRLLLEGAKKNMIGTEAADFDYITPNSKDVKHLKDLKADYILVYFNNPDCESCETVKQRLAENELINKMVNEKKLIVLAIYPYEDQKLWKKAKYPKMMINGWNKSHQIEYAELYDLPTLPCFYLLDKDYKVIVKNEGSLNKVEAKLKDLTTPQVVGPAPEAPKASEAAPKERPMPKIKTYAAPADDPNTAKSDQMLHYLLENKGQELYDNLSETTKSHIDPKLFDNALGQVESQLGKFQNHEDWKIQEIKDMKTYNCPLNFENGKAVLVIAYDNEGKILIFNMVPPEAIRM